MVHMFLNGGGMKGGPLHQYLKGAPFAGPAKTLPTYRLDSVADEFPAMSVAHHGMSIEGELYDLELHTLRTSLLPAEPKELELGVVGLTGGGEALAMFLRHEYRDSSDLTDITRHGSWRAYLATLGRTR